MIQHADRGSLLIRAADEAPFEVAIYGQEKDITTAGLAKMNLVLHNKASGEISGNYSTFSDPRYFEDKQETVLKRFDFIVANPPFSLKNWTNGLKEYGRFDGYGDRPPEKNGDFAWLLHILKSLKDTGKAAVILPHGVLFRGNAEATIRKSIIDKGYIKSIIGLPANLFYGTGIPACILIIDKSCADKRQGVFMIDASRDFIKDGNKNRLRERDIYKIVTTFNNQIIDDPKYARFVPNKEIKIKNEYNLNISRYIDSSSIEDIQDIDAHLHGGIPSIDIDSMNEYWELFPNLKSKLFSIMREGYYNLNISKDYIRNTIHNDDDFSCYSEKIDMAFESWKLKVDNVLRNIDNDIDVKQYIIELSNILINEFSHIELVDKHDVYEVLLSYWQEVMSDDVFVLKFDGYEAGKEIENIIEYISTGKNKGKEKIVGWQGKLIPRDVIEKVFFITECSEIAKAQAIVDDTQNRLNELIEEYVEDEGILKDCLNDKDNVDIKELNKKLKEFKQIYYGGEEYKILLEYIDLYEKTKKYSKIVKELNIALENEVKEKYKKLSIEKIKELLVNHKWYYDIFDGIKKLYITTSHNMANRIEELVERYEYTLPCLENEVLEFESKVKSHLERMGFIW